jgi:hypothetical protein
MAERTQRRVESYTRTVKILKSPGFACLALAVAVVSGAIIGGLIWLGVDKRAVVHGQGPLVLAGWRLDRSSLLAGACAVVGVLSMMQFDRRSRAHAEALREVARTLGLAYEEGEVKDSRGQHPGAPLFERWRLCENRLSGTVDGAPAAMFDLLTIEGRGEGERRRSWTVILFAQSRLPFFLCVPRRWTTGAERATLTPINFDPRAEDERTRQAVADFEKAYVLGLSDTVSASGEDAIRRHFGAPRLEAMSHYPNWHVQSASGLLVLALSWTAPAADRPALWHEALELHRALVAPLSPDVTPIPAAPGMDVGRQRARGEGRRAGCLAGAVICFFGSGIAVVSFIASRIRQLHLVAPWLVPAFPGIVLGGLLVGALTGRWLGGFVADLRYRPTRRGAPPPKIHKGWVFAGAGLGWIVGLAIGMGLAIVVIPHVQPMWLRPIFCFSPPVLCLILGGLAGLRVARQRAATRMGK